MSSSSLPALTTKRVKTMTTTQTTTQTATQTTVTTPPPETAARTIATTPEPLTPPAPSIAASLRSAAAPLLPLLPLLPPLAPLPLPTSATAPPPKIDRAMATDGLTTAPRRISLDPESVQNGLGQLVLTLVKLLHELLEKQAIRRLEAGGLSDDQVERLGMTLLRQSEEIARLRDVFGLKDEDLNLDLGPLGKLL